MEGLYKRKPTVILRNMPEALWTNAKIAAARKGVFLNKWVCAAIEAKLLEEAKEGAS